MGEREMGFDTNRIVGIDIGAETLKAVELIYKGDRPDQLQWTRRALVEHHKAPEQMLPELLAQWGWDGVERAAICGRLSRSSKLYRVPEKQARAAGFRFLHPNAGPTTVVSIGGHGFSVLELRDQGVEIFRENSRCSQGTGNFLRQLVERFGLSIEEASTLCADVEDPAPLSGRCPVILKTDMTHLANQGRSQPRILAGLYDAVAENVQVLIKPRVGPPHVMLAGGVTRSRRIRENFAGFLERNKMTLMATDPDEALFIDALGCAATAAAETNARVVPIASVLAEPERVKLDQLPALTTAMDRVKRMVAPPTPAPNGVVRRLVLGLDIGSTGSKAVALDARTRELVWQGYRNTSGDPVGAARGLVAQFVDSPWAHQPVLALGATGSGREIVGSLMTTCYKAEHVFVLNEIAAHAEGALSYDDRVDTIFEIGGQDAKYIRLSGGRVVDAAMNEACSAGTGSFIEEQGRRFQGIRDVVHLGQEALEADSGVSLGQHCSVFMAEIIDEAVAAGTQRRRIIAGIYDSIIQNYLNRVKGTRSVGDVIFCQGMPFSSDALAAAAARQTGAEVIVPPNPGTIGALGIALLTRRERLDEAQIHGHGDEVPTGIDLQRFLDSEVINRDNFVCGSTKGCGGAGNKCRIDRIATRVEGKKQRFTWGGGCSLYDRGTGRVKLPDGAPDPFREREELVAEIIAGLSGDGTRKKVGLTDEFLLKGLFPFFATFIRELGLDLDVHRGADQKVLKRGIEEANVPFCAPMQQFHGVAANMADAEPDFLFMPMIRTLPRVSGEERSVLCPIVQSAPDLLRWDLGKRAAGKIVSPIIDVGDEGLRSESFIEGCRVLAKALGVDTGNGLDDPTGPWHAAYVNALIAQERFDDCCLALGERAVRFCADHGIVPVVVLGRPYTIYNKVLNSNVPAILREQGALPIPIDCYPVADDVPYFNDIFWGYGQRSLRAAHQIRRTPGAYTLWCSNYACGPDSFNLHFYAYIMEGKPYAIIETDGHSGDAGTKTRVEAFLYCVREDLRQLEIDPQSATPRNSAKRPASLKHLELEQSNLVDARRRNEVLLLPRMGPSAESIAAALRGIGVRAECLPLPDRDALSIGRRYTSGKECVPMCITLGSLLQRLDGEEESEDLFTFVMPTAKGPCRFGVYNLLHKIALERLGWGRRVKVWSPEDVDYFRGVPAGFAVLAFCGFMASDLLLEALYDVRPVERQPGAAQKIYDQFFAEVSQVAERAGAGDLSLPHSLAEVATGRFFGFTDLLRRAGVAFAAIKRAVAVPTVLVVGEIYVRCDPFANDFIIDRLQAEGIRVRFAPFNEWLEYTDYIMFQNGENRGFGSWVTSRVQNQIQTRTYQIIGDLLGWPARTTVQATLDAAEPYLRAELEGEAVLTLGGPVHEWKEGLIDAVINIGPLECMPSKIAEAQFFHVAEQEGLLSLTLALNGDPVDPEVIDNFVYEVKARHNPNKIPVGAERNRWRERSKRILTELRNLGSVLPVRLPLTGAAALPKLSKPALPKFSKPAWLSTKRNETAGSLDAEARATRPTAAPGPLDSVAQTPVSRQSRRPTA